MRKLTDVDPKWAWSTYVPDGRRPWNRMRANHLFRRAAFGATTQEVDAALSDAPADVVRQLVTATETAEFKEEMRSLTRASLAAGNSENLAACWLHRMLHTSAPLTEHMVLFWHGHFATSAEKVNDARMMQTQHQLFRQYALGDFGKLVHEISRDPAMLIYLDSVTNRKSHPNENYAREVMELFCLGEGNYSERDIQELARCFTGWEVRRRQFRFNRYQHDFGEKTILGHTGTFDGDQGVDLVLKQDACPRFLVSKLVRWFISDEVTFSHPVLQPLCDQFSENGHQLAPLVTRILSSNLFFSDDVVGQKVRSPVDFAVGMLRSLEATTNMYELAEHLSRSGQKLFYPPNVKGWDGGRAWINTSTLLGRTNLLNRIISNGTMRVRVGSLKEYAAQNDLDSASSLVDHFTELLLAIPIGPEIRTTLVRRCEASEEAGSDRRIGELIFAIGTLPEYQLA